MKPSKARSAPNLARGFIACINSHDVDGLAALMTEDHVFIDATGAKHGPRDTMKLGWREYFAAFPDYLIEIEEVIANESRVVMTGTASATSSGTKKAFKVPAAWNVVIRDGLVAEWRVWCDVEPMLRSMGIDRFGETPARPAKFTTKQGQYLAFIYYYTKLHGRPPAEREMQYFFNVSPPAVHDMILALEKRGFIERTAGTARSIRVLVPRDELPALD